MFSHNMAVNKATLCSPFYAMFGYDPRAPLWPDGDMFPGNGNVEDQRADPKLTLRHSCKVMHASAHAKISTFGNNIQPRPTRATRNPGQPTSQTKWSGAEYMNIQEKTLSYNHSGRKGSLSDMVTT
jgi:hypothetical protein